MFPFGRGRGRLGWKAVRWTGWLRRGDKAKVIRGGGLVGRLLGEEGTIGTARRSGLLCRG
jgi:hypothetical protein